MLAPFPETGRIDVPAALARDLLRGAEALPTYDNRDFYSSDLQEHVRAAVRAAAPAGFDWLAGEVRQKLSRPPYCVLVSGLLFDEGNRLFVAFNRAFGRLVARPYQAPRAQLVHYIQPATDIASARGGHESERLHTDAADWETPVEIISMVCVRADPAGGGRSRVLDVDAARDEVRQQLGAATLDLLEREPVPWQLADYCGGGLRWRTVLAESRMCLRRYTIDLALDSKQATLSAEMLDALDRFESVVSSTPRTTEFLMREGELLFSDNTRTIHARTPLADGRASRRLMIRSWIQTS